MYGLNVFRLELEVQMQFDLSLDCMAPFPHICFLSTFNFFVILNDSTCIKKRFYWIHPGGGRTSACANNFLKDAVKQISASVHETLEFLWHLSQLGSPPPREPLPEGKPVFIMWTGAWWQTLEPSFFWQNQSKTNKLDTQGLFICLKL
jgi:hypothetical protein